MPKLDEIDNEVTVFERFFKISLDLLCIADMNGNFVKVNNSWVKILGYATEELEGRQFLDFVHPDDIESTLNVMAVLKKQKQVLNFTNRYKCADGSYRHIEWRSQLYENMIYATARDITERKNLEFQLESQKRFLNSVIDAIPDVIFLKDTDSKYIGCNKAFVEKIAESGKEEAIGKTDFQYFNDPTVAKKNIAQDKVIMDSKKSQTNYIIRKTPDGIIDFETIKTPLTDENGNVIGIIGIARDITLRKNNERKLEETKARLLEAQELAHIGDWEYDVIKKQIYWADEIYRIYGLEPQAFTPRKTTSYKYIHPDDLDYFKKAEVYLMSGGLEDFEYRYIGNQNKMGWITVNIRKIFNEEGELIFLRGTVQDITQRKILEEEINKARHEADLANNAKSQFISNMSHEIRNPLNGIIGFLELLSETRLTSEQKKYLEEAEIASEALLVLVNNVLDFSKIEADKASLENINFKLRTLLQETVITNIPQSNKKNLKINTYLSSDIPINIVGDPIRLKQILNNLVSNAVKFTEEGEITVDIQLKKNTENNIELLFKVEDTGIGISEEVIEKIFDSFTQGDNSTTRIYGGTGLGLSISKKLVELMGGTIWVESEQDKGSKFYFTAIFNHSNKYDNTASVRDKGKKNYNINKNIKLLVVEDSAANTRLMIESLKNKGLSCDAVKNGEEAIEACINKHYDIVFMDCQMPVMDGFEATKKIRSIKGIGEKIIIIAITANAMEDDREKCLASGMDDYISKPININNVCALIEKYGFIASKTIIDTIVKKLALEMEIEVDQCYELIGEYIEPMTLSIKQIYHDIECQDFISAKKIIHKMKGTAKNLRMDNLAHLLIKLEIALPEQNKDTLLSIIFNIRKYIEVLSDEIKL